VFSGFPQVQSIRPLARFNPVEPNSEVNGHHGHQAKPPSKVILQATPTQSSCPCPVKEL
jgi:hypothetical protein